MAMSPQEMVDFCREDAAMSWDAAVEAARKSDGYLVAVNVGGAFTSSVKEGLVGWRCQLASPVRPFKEAVRRVNEGIALLQSLKSLEFTSDVPTERASIIGYLVDVPSPVESLSDLTSDRLLDAVLGKALWGEWDESAWNEGLQKLQKNKRAALSVETYLNYANLVRGEASTTDELVHIAMRLFEKRAKNAFFTGGFQTEGGGPNNAVTVDYRLAAVMKKIGYTRENLHRWNWG